MSKQKDLLVLLQRALPRFASDLDHKMRALRQGDQALLPQGGRGPHAPELTPADAAYMLIAALSLERPKEENVLQETIAMADLPNIVAEVHLTPGVVEPWRLPDADDFDPRYPANNEIHCSATFHEALVYALTRLCSPPVLYVRLFPMSRGAEICFRHEYYDQDRPFDEGDKVIFGRTDSMSTPIGVSFEVSAVLLNQIKSMLQVTPDSAEQIADT